MSDRDIARFVRASVRRYAAERSEPWHVEAHEVATELLAAIEGEEAPSPERALGWAQHLARLPASRRSPAVRSPTTGTAG